jgi:hypothetical protein
MKTFPRLSACRRLGNFLTVWIGLFAAPLWLPFFFYGMLLYYFTGEGRGDLSIVAVGKSGPFGDEE